jgi:tellurite resistance protein TerB
MEQRHNRPFLKAAMAACAMVSFADGEVHLCDRVRLDQIMETLEELKIFDPHEGVELFNYYTEQLEKSSKRGHEEALAAIKVVANNKSTAELLIRLCLAISLSDGKTNLVEQIEIVSLCSLLGVDSKNLGLDMNALLSTAKTDISK